MISQLTITLASTLLVSGAESADVSSRLVDEVVSRIERLENGSSAADYYLCYTSNRRHPFFRSVAPNDLFDGFDAALQSLDDVSSIYREVSNEDFHQAIGDKIEARQLTRACNYILIPDSAYLRRIADQAEYRMNAERQLVNPAQDYGALLDDHLDRLQALSNGRTVLTAGACLQRHQWPGSYQAIPIADFSSDSQNVDASYETFFTAASVLAMSHHLFDEEAIWDAAYDARVAPMSRRECQQLLTPYLAD